MERIAAAPVEREPFPHCVVDDVFPADFYESLLDEWPDAAAFRRLVDTNRVGKTYSPARRVVELEKAGAFWREEVLAWLAGAPFCAALADKFRDVTAPRVAKAGGVLGRDAILVSDGGGYVLGPHTDAPHRLVSALFYLALDRWTFAEAIGTALFRPKDRAFRCAGGPSYPFEPFEIVKRVAFLPNRLFLFPKTDDSFHGVERIALEGLDRRMLLFDLRVPA